MSNLQNCTSLQEATGKLEYRLTNDCMFHIVFQKSPKALRGLCASLLHMSPEEIRLERAEAALQARTLELEENEATIQKMDAALQEKDTALLEKDAEIARLTALLANK